MIEDSANCCGCTACASVCNRRAITMMPNEKGFLYPFTDVDKCNSCGLCETICPISNRKSNTFDSNVSNVKSAYALRLKNKEDLLQSSSGGAFTMLAKYVIDKKGVVYGAIYDNDMVVRHSSACTIDGCLQFRGSKYSQSDLCGVYHEIKQNLQEDKLVLFTGTPCQCDGLINSLRRPYNNLITVDVICHSIPSPQYYKQYISMIEDIFGKKLRNIRMRDKTMGWGADSYKFIFTDDTYVLNPNKIRCWQTIFESGLITRESCFECRYTNLHRATDFTIGDFWDFDNKRPEIRSKEGTSVLLLNSDKGLRIFDDVKDNVNYWSVSVDEFMQPRLQSSSIRPALYDKFWNDYFNKGFDYSYETWFKPRTGFILKLSKIKQLILKLNK